MLVDNNQFKSLSSESRPDKDELSLKSSKILLNFNQIYCPNEISNHTLNKIFKSTLRNYQLKTLHWMISRENMEPFSDK